MNRVVFLIFPLIVLLASCGESDPMANFEFVPLSKFSMDETSIANHDLVEIIYSSGGPDLNPEKDYYYQHIVISMSTGDTVRILTANRAQTRLTGPNKIFISQSSGDAMDRLINYAPFGKVESGMTIEEIEFPVIERVISNKNHQYFELRDFPTVIGVLAEAEGFDLGTVTR